MSLQLIYGPSGSGKSHMLYETMIRQSLAEPKREFFVIVPEQFTLQTQKELVEMHPRKGILNIDVLSFQRLAWRVFEETGTKRHTILEETGKSLLLRRAASKRRRELKMLGSHVDKPGYISQIKDVISELKEYGVSIEELDERIAAQKEGALRCKLEDIRTLYAGFEEELQDKYITSEEILEELCAAAERSELLKDCVIGLDGFAGFQPVQKKLLQKLMKQASRVLVTVTLDAAEDPMKKASMHQLSYFSKKMIQGLLQAAGESRVEIEKPIILGREGSIRFADADALGFLERHIFRSGRHVYERAQDCISMHVSKDAKTEAEFAARTIWRLVREEGLRYREIAVITGDMESFGDHVKKVFTEHEIPCFLDRTKKIKLNPMIEFIRAALEIAAKSFSYESVFRYLRTGLAELCAAETDILENYVLARGIKSRVRWEETWTEGTRGITEEEAQECQRLKEKMLPSLLTFADRIKGRKGTVRQKTEALYRLLTEHQIQEKMAAYETYFQEKGAFDAAREYSQIYAAVIRLFDKMVELLGDEPMSLKEYMEILDAGFEEAKVGLVPPTADSVLVGDIKRTRLKDIKVLFFLGLNDGWVPKKEEKTSILSDMDREELEKDGMELAPTARENSYLQKFYLYLNLTKPSRRLYLSYGRTGLDGSTLRPSYLSGVILRMFPKMQITDEDAEDNRIGKITSARRGIAYLAEGMRRLALDGTDAGSLALFAWYDKQEAYKETVRRLLDAAFLTGEKEGMSRTVARELYGKTLVNSVSRLEQFAACAYAHFLRYGLRASERETYEFQPADMGNVFHKALELCAEEIEKSGDSWFTISRAALEALSDRVVWQTAESYAGYLLNGSARSRAMIGRMQRIMRRTVWALTEQIRAGSFVPSNFEVSFTTAEDLESVKITLSEEEKMKLRGRIDRIDTFETEEKVYVKVVDYKSGNTQFDLAALYYGLQLQLVVYMNAALELEKRIHPEKEIIPAGIFYYHIQDPMLEREKQETPEEIEQRLLRQMKPNGLVNGSMEAVKALDRGLAKDSDVIPVSLNRDGSYSRYSQVVSKAQFDSLSAFVTEKMKEIGCAILEGETAADPYEKKGKTPCTYCPFGEICRFDLKIPGTQYRRLKDDTPEEIWRKLEEE